MIFKYSRDVDDFNIIYKPFVFHFYEGKFSVKLLNIDFIILIQNFLKIDIVIRFCSSIQSFKITVIVITVTMELSVVGYCQTQDRKDLNSVFWDVRRQRKLSYTNSDNYLILSEIIILYYPILLLTTIFDSQTIILDYSRLSLITFLDNLRQPS